MGSNPQNRALFSEMIDLRGQMLRLTLKNEHKYVFHFSKTSEGSPLKRNSINKCVLKPSEQGSFFQDDHLRGHMPRFS